MKHLPKFFYLVDVGFILYWVVTALGVMPSEYLYNDYKNPILVAWNWSFFPIDILVSATGLCSLYWRRKGNPNWKKLALLSLGFTCASGLMAISFWTLTLDFKLEWWLPNLFLFIYPLYFISGLLTEEVDRGMG
jgi:hypothetical protein